MKIKKYFHSKKNNNNKIIFSSEHVSWHERLGEDPYTGWIMITSVSFLTVVVLVIIAGNLFLLINSGGVKAAQTAALSQNRSILDPKALDAVVSSFEAKSSATAALKQGYVGPPDPSQ